MDTIQLLNTELVDREEQDELSYLAEMAWTKRLFSNGQVDKAGATLINESASPAERDHAYTVLSNGNYPFTPSKRCDIMQKCSDSENHAIILSFHSELSAADFSLVVL